jgi:hypothetical protein
VAAFNSSASKDSIAEERAKHYAVGWTGDFLGRPSSTERAIQSGGQNAALASPYESFPSDASRSLLHVRKARDQPSAAEKRTPSAFNTRSLALRTDKESDSVGYLIYFLFDTAGLLETCTPRRVRCQLHTAAKFHLIQYRGPAQ